MTNELISMISIIGIGAFVIAIVVSAISAPKPWLPRSEWFKRSLVSGTIATAGILFLMFAVIIAMTSAANFDSFWQIMPVVTIGVILIWFLSIFGIYSRVILWNKYNQFLGHISTNLKNNNRPPR